MNRPVVTILSVAAVLLLIAIIFIGCTSCGGPQTVETWQEYDQPFYPNQQPAYVDGDYYIFEQGGVYRRVPRTRVVYIQNPLIIPVLPDTQRTVIYNNIPHVTVPASQANPNSIIRPNGSTAPSTSRPSSTSTSSRPSTAPSTSRPSSAPSMSRSTAPSSSRPSSSGRH